MTLGERLEKLRGGELSKKRRKEGNKIEKEGPRVQKHFKWGG